MSESGKRFMLYWLGLVTAGEITFIKWYTNTLNTLSDGYYLMFSAYLLPIIKNPIYAAFIMFFPTLCFFILSYMGLRVNGQSDDFMLSTRLQEMQGLWIAISLGWFFFIASNANSPDMTINRAMDTSALASLFFTFLLYRHTRKRIVTVHKKHSTCISERTRIQVCVKNEQEFTGN